MKLIAVDTLQTKHKVSLFAIGMVLVSYLFYVFLLVPRWTEMDTLKSQYQMESQQVKVIEAFALAHPNPEEHVTQLDTKIMAVNKLLPDQPEISTFLLQLEQLSKETGVQLSYLKPGKTTNKEGYREIDIEFSINGRFNNIMNFLSKTESGTRFMNIHNLGIQLGKNGVETKLAAKIYSYGVTATPGTGDKKK